MPIYPQFGTVIYEIKKLFKGLLGGNICPGAANSGLNARN